MASSKNSNKNTSPAPVPAPPVLNLTGTWQAATVVQAASDAALSAVASDDQQRIYQTPGKTVIVKTTKDVYVNTYEQVTEQKYITTGAAGEVTSIIAGTNVTISSTGPGGTGDVTVNAVGGGGTPGGNDTQVQFNDGGAFAGNSGFTYNKITNTVGLTNIANDTDINIKLPGTAAWYSLYGDLPTDTQDHYSSAVAYDTAGNIYSIGADGSNGIPFLAKYDNVGNILWQKIFTEPSNYYKIGDAVATDSNNNVYCAIDVDDTARYFVIFKLSSTGTVIWQTKMSYGANVGTRATDMIVDSASNIYICAHEDATDSTLIAKFNSSGVIQWQRQLTALDGYPTSIDVDTSGNVFVSMHHWNGTYIVSVIAKYNSSGSLQWQKQYDAGFNTYSGSVKVDNLGNIYKTNYSTSVSAASSSISKLDSSGNIVWQRNLGGVVLSNAYTYGIAVDSNNYIYITGAIEPAQDLFVAKYNSSGNLQWQRIFAGTGFEDQYYYWSYKNIAVLDPQYVISGYTYTPSLYASESLVVQMPTDGSLTGTYGNFTYSVGSLTETSTAFSVSTGTMTDSAGTYVATTGTITVANAENTNTLTTISNAENNFYFRTDGSIELPNYSFPPTDGACNQALITDGAGNITWGSAQITLDSNNSLAIGGGLSNSTGTDNIGIGFYALFTNTTGINNIALGSASLSGNTFGCNNIGVGVNALACNISGTSNIAVGTNALVCNSCGYQNIAIGREALFFNLSGHTNTAVGYQSLVGNSYGSQNTAIGAISLDFNMSGCNNVAVGYAALFCNLTSNNTAVGHNSLRLLSTGTNNIGIGVDAGCLIVTGNNNTVIGSLGGAAGCVCTVLIGAGACERIKVDNTGLYINGSCWCSGGGGGASLDAYCSFKVGNGLASSTGLNNTAIGCNTLLCNSTGSNNFGNGYGALKNNSAGCNNVSIGCFSLYCNLTGSNNIAIGASALRLNTSGFNNISQGYSTLRNNTIGSCNIAIGSVALRCNTVGCNNIAHGASALACNISGCNNIAIGTSALGTNITGSNNTAIGTGAMICNVLGNHNIALGQNSLYRNNCGSNNIAQGYNALSFNTTGQNNIAIGISALKCSGYGCSNVAIGNCSLFLNFNGSNNIGIGEKSLYASVIGNNIGIGVNAGCSLTTGTNNTIIGSLIGSVGLVCTVLIGAGTCERIKVDNTGLCINGAPYSPTVNLDAYCSFKVGNGLASSTGTNNIAFGCNTMLSNTVGCDNFAVGLQALQCNLSGGQNVAIGRTALKCNIGGYHNIAIGEKTLYGNSGSYNIAMGRYALNSASSSGLYNIALGYGSLRTSTSGCLNISIGGIDAGCSITTGVNNTIIGSLPGSAGLVCTVLIGAGTCERIKVDNTGLCINGGSLFTNNGSAIYIKNTYEAIVPLSGATGVVTHNFSQGSIFNHTSIAGDFTANFTNLNLTAGNATNAVLILNQGATAYLPTAVQIGGVAQTINWQGGSSPTGNANQKDIVSFSITNISSTYTVFGQLVTFA